MASIVVNGDTSGAVTLSAPAVAGTVTVTLPSANGTMLTTASSTGISGSAISSGTVAEAYGGTGTSTGYYGFKNRIINGAMVIDQRNAGASITPTDGQFSVDRWNFYRTQASKFTAQQNAAAVTPPAGFKNYLGITSSSAYSITSSDLFGLNHRIEGFNFSDCEWGTANAQPITLSFWVRSSLTGTFGGSLMNSAENRSYPFSFTISSANTWEYKTETVAGDTTGTWVGATNGTGLQIWFGLGCGATRSGTADAWAGSAFFSATGAVSVVGTSGATFYITGVQLEKGSTATSFDYRPYGTELALCQRYFEKSFDIDFAPANGPNATSNATDNGYSSTVAGNNSLVGGPIKYAVAKRTAATITSFGNNSGYWGYLSSSASSTKTWSASAVLFAGQGTSGFGVIQNVTNNVYYTIQGHWTASAEL